MDCKAINPEFSVTAQLKPSDLPLVHSLGFRSVICNRPDGEEADQPLFESIEQAARISDMSAQYIPVSPSGVSTENVATFQAIIQNLPKPVLAYCRTGGRSSALFEAVKSADKSE